MRGLLALGLAGALAACPPPASGTDAGSSEPPTTCTKLGAPCTVSPGKLGTCVEVERPGAPSAFVCQSQH